MKHYPNRFICDDLLAKSCPISVLINGSPLRLANQSSVIGISVKPFRLNGFALASRDKITKPNSRKIFAVSSVQRFHGGVKCWSDLHRNSFPTFFFRSEYRQIERGVCAKLQTRTYALILRDFYAKNRVDERLRVADFY